MEDLKRLRNSGTKVRAEPFRFTTDETIVLCELGEGDEGMKFTQRSLQRPAVFLRFCAPLRGGHFQRVAIIVWRGWYLGKYTLKHQM